MIETKMGATMDMTYQHLTDLANVLLSTDKGKPCFYGLIYRHERQKARRYYYGIIKDGMQSSLKFWQDMLDDKWPMSDWDFATDLTEREIKDIYAKAREVIGWAWKVEYNAVKAQQEQQSNADQPTLYEQPFRLPASYEALWTAIAYNKKAFDPQKWYKDLIEMLVGYFSIQLCKINENDTSPTLVFFDGKAYNDDLDRLYVYIHTIANYAYSWPKTFSFEKVMDYIEQYRHGGFGLTQLQPEYTAWQNCVVWHDFKTGRYVRLLHSPSYMVIGCNGCDYNPSADTARAESFLREYARNDDLTDPAEIKQYSDQVYANIVQSIAVFLRPDNLFKCEPYFEGNADCGKTTLAGIITSILGQNNVSHVALQAFDLNRFSYASCYGKTMNICDEAGKAKCTLATQEVLKTITGGGRIFCERKGKDAFEYTPRFKNLYLGNGMPKFRNEALLRRWQVIPFKHNFRYEDKNPCIDKALLEGIALLADTEYAAMMVRWNSGKDAFTYSQTSEAYKNEHNQSNDPISEWISHFGTYADFLRAIDSANVQGGAKANIEQIRLYRDFVEYQKAVNPEYKVTFNHCAFGAEIVRTSHGALTKRRTCITTADGTHMGYLFTVTPKGQQVIRDTAEGTDDDLPKQVKAYLPAAYPEPWCKDLIYAPAEALTPDSRKLRKKPIFGTFLNPDNTPMDAAQLAAQGLKPIQEMLNDTTPYDYDPAAPVKWHAPKDFEEYAQQVADGTNAAPADGMKSGWRIERSKEQEQAARAKAMAARAHDGTIQLKPNEYIAGGAVQKCPSGMESEFEAFKQAQADFNAASGMTAQQPATAQTATAQPATAQTTVASMNASGQITPQNQAEQAAAMSAHDAITGIIKGLAAVQDKGLANAEQIKGLAEMFLTALGVPLNGAVSSQGTAPQSQTVQTTVQTPAVNPDVNTHTPAAQQTNTPTV